MEKKATWARILSVIAVVIVFRFIGGMLGNEMAKQSTQRKMEEHFQRSSEYVSGTCTSTKYYSDFWNIKFETTEDWWMYSKNELEEINEDLKENAVVKSIEYYNNNNLDYDKQLVEDMHNKIVNQWEMGALYYSGDEPVGEASLWVIDTMGYTFDEWIDDFFDTSTLKAMEDVTTGEQIIAGETYKMIKSEYTFEGIDMSSDVFLRYKDGLVCILNCKYSSAHKEVLDSFLTRVSTYD